MYTQRYNRIEWLQYGSNRETFDLMCCADHGDMDLARDSFKTAQREKISYVDMVKRIINGHSEEAREALEGEDNIGARIY